MNNLTEVVFILDRSGSMEHLTDDTIGGFNALLKKQKKEEGDCLVSTYLFDNEVSLLHDRLPIGEIPPMDREQYYTRGCTALLDCMGEAITHIEQIHHYIRKEDVPARTLFVITTDGMENASQGFTADQVKRLVKKHEEDGWEFLFIGANIDSVETASRVGIKPSRAANYRADASGMKLMFTCVSDSMASYRKKGKVGEEWKEKLEKSKQ